MFFDYDDLGESDRIVRNCSMSLQEDEDYRVFEVHRDFVIVQIFAKSQFPAKLRGSEDLNEQDANQLWKPFTGSTTIRTPAPRTRSRPSSATCAS